MFATHRLLSSGTQRSLKFLVLIKLSRCPNQNSLRFPSLYLFPCYLEYNSQVSKLQHLTCKLWSQSQGSWRQTREQGVERCGRRNREKQAAYRRQSVGAAHNFTGAKITVSTASSGVQLHHVMCSQGRARNTKV